MRSAFELVGFTSKPITLAWGTSSESSSNCLGNSSAVSMQTPREVAAGPGEAGHEAGLDWVYAGFEDDRDRRGCVLCGQCRGHTASRDQIDVAFDEVGGQYGQLIIAALCPAVLDRHVLAFDMTGFAQSLAEGRHKRR